MLQLIIKCPRLNTLIIYFILLHRFSTFRINFSYISKGTLFFPLICFSLIYFLPFFHKIISKIYVPLVNSHSRFSAGRLIYTYVYVFPSLFRGPIPCRRGRTPRPRRIALIYVEVSGTSRHRIRLASTSVIDAAGRYTCLVPWRHPYAPTRWYPCWSSCWSSWGSPESRCTSSSVGKALFRSWERIRARRNTTNILNYYLSNFYLIILIIINNIDLFEPQIIIKEGFKNYCAWLLLVLLVPNFAFIQQSLINLLF